MNVINVVVWGLGPHAIKNILPALTMCPGVCLYGICSRNADIVSRFTARYECKGWVDSGPMLEDPKVDVVYLSTPIGLHASQGRSVLLADKHLWCEKPLAENLAQASDLVHLSRERRISLAEGFMYLYHPQFLQLRGILDSGRLGHLQHVTVRFGIPALDSPGFRNHPALGGGAFLDVGSHPISAIVSLLPEHNPEVLLSATFVAPGSPVDTKGQAILRCSGSGNPVDVTLEWGINCSYRNEIDLWGSKQSVTSEYFFSKPSDYVPKFRFLDLNGNESFEYGRAANHFVAMLSAFRGFVANPDAAEAERIAIIRRAELIDKIQRRKI